MQTQDPSTSSNPAQADPPKPPSILYSWRTNALSPVAGAPTRLAYVRDVQRANFEVELLLTSGHALLGFDIEWKPNYVKGEQENPVALIQLAAIDTILLIQVSAMASFPDRLRELLGRPDIVKAGVGIRYDCKKLYLNHAVHTRGCVDLSLLARSVDNARWKGKYSEPIGLARLVETYEQRALPKGKVQRSNWERLLNDQQQDYAANDAHSALAVLIKLMTMSQYMESVPKSVYYSFDVIEGTPCHPDGVEWHAENPEYDPGPPPPPKEPKDNKKKDGEGKRKGKGKDGEQTSKDGKTPQSQPPNRNRPRYKHQGQMATMTSISYGMSHIGINGRSGFVTTEGPAHPSPGYPYINDFSSGEPQAPRRPRRPMRRPKPSEAVTSTSAS
ncbi:hypothetical protein JAAARDRAFT_196177 [Jaapia argillacea MUCL 33604]|uniref:3'-5' exonuclease domain-containing protein n=1 Tax=Jaapia argillacea MUCL 33604 TaxID=933084 RepID=A0A067PU07_9AGAM|nr:hypothetical protein JAAARDRAFT_196177 [Jaapia argillacea MUCL 33604]